MKAGDGSAGGGAPRFLAPGVNETEGRRGWPMPDVRVDRRGIAIGVYMALLLGLFFTFFSMKEWGWGLGNSHLTVVLMAITAAGALASIPVVFLFHSFYRCPTCRTRLKPKHPEKHRIGVYSCSRCQVDWVTGWVEGDSG